MARKILLLIMMSCLVALGGFWALQAQDPPQTPKTDPPAVSAQTTQTDLSGTYTGTFNCEALGLSGDTTLTITGNEFTTADGKTGRIIATNTRGYIAVAFQLGGTAPPTTPTATAAPTTAPMVVSMRARKSGSRLTLTPAPGTNMKCSFTPSRGVARGRRNPRTPAATGTEVSNPVTAPVPTESPTAPTPSQTPSPVPTPSPEPEPSPTPSGSPTPAPSPSPGEPTPSPTPAPSPTPTPSPTPSPSPRPGI